MNEELMIIIRANTAGARREIGAVREELEGVQTDARGAGNSVDEAMKSIRKGALAAIGTITALAAAMTALGKSAQEINKGFGKLKTSFVNAGSSAKEATKYYKELFGVLGDHDRTIETGQSLARVTTDPAALGDYKNIMAGAVSQYGDGYNSEALAENIAETIAAAKVTGDLERVLVEAGISADAFNNALAQATSTEERELLVRSTLNGVLGNAGKAYIAANQGTIQYNESQARLNLALAETTKYTTPLMIQLSNLATVALQELKPAFEIIAAALLVVIKVITAVIKAIGAFFGLFSDEGEKAGKTLDDLGSSLDSAGGLGIKEELSGANTEAQKLKKQLMGFDELNVVSSDTSTPASAGGGIVTGSMQITDIQMPEIDTSNLGLDDFQLDMEVIEQKAQSIATLAGIAGAAFLAWKITGLIQGLQNGTILMTDVKDKAKSVGGQLMVAAGAALLVSGYSDAWVNGIDWGNFALILAGIGLTVGGLVLAVSPLAGAIATVAGGIAMVVLGIKDFVENGYSMEAVITIAVGAILILVGAVWAFNAALLANPITWVIAAIMALVAVFVILWNECDGFRQFWINLWDMICDAFDATVEWLGDAVDAVVDFFVGAWEGIKKAWSAVTGFFSGVWEGIKSVFSKVGTWFKDIFKGAWEAVKRVFSAGGKIFDGIKEGIVSTFKTVVNGLITGINKVVALPFKGLNGILDTIHDISILGVEPFKWLTWRAPIPQLPMLAKGGIVNSTTVAMIGERGKEAVIPLENNTEWMDTLADRIAARNTSPSKIVLTLDGKELGYASINSINQVTKQTGKLQLVLA